MKYKAIENFYFKRLDSDNYYESGQDFPRKGVEVSQEELNSLLSSNNSHKKPFIEEVNNLSNYTVKQLKKMLDDRKIEYKSDLKKDELIEMLK